MLLAGDEARPRGNRVYARYAWSEILPCGQLSHPLALDLVEIVRAIHLADRAVRRSPFLGKRLRRIELTVPVACPSLWRGVGAAVEALANFASADEWRLNFRAKPGDIGRRWSNERPAASWDVVALFSGGLDSLCGAAYRAERRDRVLFVTHTPPGRERVAELVGDVWKAFGRDPENAATASFRLQPAERGPSGTRAMFHEHSRRSRPLYFLGLASAVAVDLGVSVIQMSENGALGQSLPYRYDSYGGTLARQAHEYMLAGFASLLDAIVPRRGDWRVENPLNAMTKGEACRLLGPAAPLAVRSVSCEYVGKQAAALRHWKGERRATGPARRLGEGPQCGACLPCVVRRAALLSAGIGDPDSEYFFDARGLRYWERLSPEDRPALFSRVEGHPFYLRRFCRRVLCMSQCDFCVQFLPELRLARDPGLKVTKPAVRYKLMRRYAREMLAFLDSQPAPSPRAARVRKSS
jgi:hypothetical protein